MTKEQFNWRAHLQVHPAAELFPLLSAAELKELADDIERARGIHYQIVLDVKGRLLDGRNRLDALVLLGRLGADKAGKLLIKDYGPLPITTIAEDPYDLVISLNLHRRHVTAEQKRELIAKVLKAKPGQSNNAVAKQVKADDKTVAKVRRDLESTSEIPKLEKTVGADGKSRPANKPTPKAPRHGRDVALENFDAHVVELLGLIKGQNPQRFSSTTVPLPLIGDLAHHLRELVSVRTFEPGGHS